MTRRLAASLLLALSAGASAISQERIPTTTGLILGAVVDSTGAGVARALVELAGEGAGGAWVGRRVMADEHGEFLFADVPGGEYQLSASKPGYVDGRWGQRRPAAFPRVLVLASGERRMDLAITIWKHAAVTGTVTDDSGAPVIAAEIAAYRPTIVAGRLRFQSARSAFTDDRGEFRIHSLPPDDYCIVFMGGARAATFDDADSPFRQRALVYPTVVQPAPIEGRPQELITVAPGAMTSGIHFRVTPVAGTRVSGALRGGEGLSQTTVRLVAQPVASLPGLESEARLEQFQTDGRFAFSPMVPGSYVFLSTRTGREPSDPAAAFPPLFAASIPVSVGAADVVLPFVDLQPTARISGRLTFEGTPPPASELSRLLAIGIHRADGASLQALPRIRMTGGYDFTTSGLWPGSYLLYVDNPNEKWWLQTVTVAGRDSGGLPINVGADDVNDVSIVLSDRAAYIDAAVELPAGQPAGGIDVILFPADTRRWVDTGPYGSPAGAYPVSPAGRFSIPVRPGDYFVLATSTDLGQLWRTPSVLTRLSALAQRIHVPAGQRIAVGLPVQAVR